MATLKAIKPVWEVEIPTEPLSYRRREEDGVAKFVGILLRLKYKSTDLINITRKAVSRCGCDMICFVKAGCVKNSEEMLSRHLLCVFTDLTGLGEENAAGYNGAHRAGYCVKACVCV